MGLEDKSEPTLHQLVDKLAKDWNIKEFMAKCREKPELFLNFFRFPGYSIPSFYHIVHLYRYRHKDNPQSLLKIFHFTKELLDKGFLTKQLLEQRMADQFIEGEDGILHLLAQLGNRELFELCLEFCNPALIHEESSRHYTLATTAAKFNNIQILKCLSERGIDINAPSSTGHKPLDLYRPITSMHFTTAKFLIENGANVNADLNTALASFLNAPLNLTSPRVQVYRQQIMFLLEQGATLSFLKPTEIEQLFKDLNNPNDTHFPKSHYFPIFFYIRGLVEEKIVNNKEFSTTAGRPFFIEAIEACKTLNDILVCNRIMKYAYDNNLRHVASTASHRSADLLTLDNKFGHYNCLPGDIITNDLAVVTKNTGMDEAVLITPYIGLNTAVMIAYGIIKIATTNPISQKGIIFLKLMEEILAMPAFKQLTLENRKKLLFLLSLYGTIKKISNNDLIQFKNELFRSIYFELPSDEKDNYLQEFLIHESRREEKIHTEMDANKKFPDNKKEWEKFAVSTAYEYKNQENTDATIQWRSIAQFIAESIDAEEKQKQDKISSKDPLSLDIEELVTVTISEEKISPPPASPIVSRGMFSTSRSLELPRENDLRTQLQDQLDTLKRWCAGSSSNPSLIEIETNSLMKKVCDLVEFFLKSDMSKEAFDKIQTVFNLNDAEFLPEPLKKMNQLINNYAISKEWVKSPKTLAALFN